MAGIVLLKTFNTREEAEIVRSLLESHKIKVILKTDDAAGFYPQMDLSEGVKIFIDESNQKEANEILEIFNESEDAKRE
ncbi:MAG: hypothetical protein COX48_03595 [bacterium (Candidatus Stahlbacteria) CG23_combo_of_CG06-09_8_20_14_all_34_7]|nr:MAG: hypothetical protein COX48_03595 [bacterium (Candidatus Stahlbacteria) CG23_combo_of_CG06-09_8_20_14_all_34_7]